MLVGNDVKAGKCIASFFQAAKKFEQLATLCQINLLVRTSFQKKTYVSTTGFETIILRHKLMSSVQLKPGHATSMALLKQSTMVNSCLVYLVFGLFLYVGVNGLRFSTQSVLLSQSSITVIQLPKTRTSIRIYKK